MPDTNRSLNSEATPSKGSWWIFFAGLLIFIIFQTGLILEAQLARVHPPETDDAYCYIYNAIQLSQGFKYNAPAQKDFQSQEKPEPGDSVDRQNLKWELHHSLFFTHYILHSAFLLLISFISGVSLEIAYRISAVLGSLLIAGAISYFLLTITDRISAGLALASMAIIVFPMQGIHQVAPTNMCMALGLILLSIVLRNDGKCKWVLFGFSLILLFLHRSGVIYAALGVFISAILRYREERIKQIILDLLPTVILIGIVVIIMFIYPLYFFRLSSMSAPPNTNYFKEVWYNLIELFKLMGQWVLSHGVVLGPKPIKNIIVNYWISFLGLQLLGLVIFVAPWITEERHKTTYRYFRWISSLIGTIILLPTLSIIILILILRTGWLYPPQGKKFYFYLTFFIFLFLLFPSIFHVMYIAEPGHPIIRADLTNRLWVPFAVVLVALFARGLWVIFQQIRSRSHDFLPSNIQHSKILKQRLQTKYLWAALVLFLLVGYTPHLVEAYDYREMIKYYMIVRQNVTFNQDQVNYVIENTSPHDIIVYDDTLIRHYILCHGGLSRRAIYLPLQPLPDKFKINPASKIYKIGWNPFLFVQHYEAVRDVHYPLVIPGYSTLKLNLDPQFQPEYLQILPGSTDKRRESSKIRIIRQSAAGVIEQKDLQFSRDNWQGFPLKPVRGGSLIIKNLEPSAPFLLGGLRFDRQQENNFLWPWEGVDKVILNNEQRKLRRSALMPRKEKIKGIIYDLEVIQDFGSTVLWRLWPENRKKSRG